MQVNDGFEKNCLYNSAEMADISCPSPVNDNRGISAKILDIRQHREKLWHGIIIDKICQTNISHSVR